MRWKSLTYGFIMAFFVAFIFWVVNSIDIHNMGIQSEIEDINQMSEINSQLNIEEQKIFLKAIDRPEDKRDYLLLDRESKEVYNSNPSYFNKLQDQDIIDISSQVYPSEFIKIDQEDLLENRYIKMMALENQGLFIISFAYPTVLQTALSNIGTFILTVIVGTILISTVILYLLRRKHEEVAYLLQNINAYIDDPDFHINLRPENQGFESMIKSDAEKQRKRIDTLETELKGLNDMIVHMTEGVVLVGKDRKIASINQAAVKLLNASIKTDYRNKDILYLCRELQFYDAFQEVYRTHEPFSGNITMESNTVHVNMSPIFTEEKHFFGLMILLVDVTESQRAEKARREFTSNVTHELKTPLTSIKGYAELMSTGLVPEEDRQKFLSIILDESQRLFELIDGIIAISRIDEKYDIDEYELIDFEDIISRILLSHKLEIEQKNLDVKVILAEDNTLYSHARLMEELVGNLIDNAIVYNVENGSIHIEIIENNDVLKFVIEDTGIGISYEDQAHIFERFYMVDKSRSYNKKSTGLGLSIVKHNVEKLGGKIELISQKGVGTKFTLSFPKKP